MSIVTLAEAKEQGMKPKPIQLLDGHVTLFDTEYISKEGTCDTCDYGSAYGYSWTLVFSRLGGVVITSTEEGCPMVSESDLMLLFTRNLEYISTITEEEFLEDFLPNAFGLYELGIRRLTPKPESVWEKLAKEG